MSREIYCETGYSPGITNINEREAKSRRESGFLSVFATLIIFVFLVIINAPTPAFAVLIVPLWFAVLSYLQSTKYFCVRFAINKVHNANRKSQEPLKVVSEKAHRKDRTRANELIAISTAISSGITIVVMIFVNQM